MGNAIKQTNRTMLMETVNPEKLDILTLVGDVRGIESLSDDKIKEINDHLLVHSFDEVLEKFSPKVYYYYNASTQKVIYVTEKPEQVPEEVLEGGPEQGPKPLPRRWSKLHRQSSNSLPMKWMIRPAARDQNRTALKDIVKP